MKKIKIFFIFLLFPISFLVLPKFIYCLENNLIFFNSDKTIYYINEKIKIGASWELNYNEDSEHAFIQIHIVNSSDFLIWNSSEYDNQGINENNWTLTIKNLSLDYKNYSNHLFLKFFSSYSNLISGIKVEKILETIKIEIRKRDISYDLKGFKNTMRYGEDQLFNISFYDLSKNQMNYLIDQEINFEIFSNDSLLFNGTFTTNKFGTIEIYISSINHLKLGQNLLVFTLTNEWIYNCSEFRFDLILLKKQINVKIIEYKESLKLNEDLRFKVYFFYLSNNISAPLNNSNIIFKILNDNDLIFLEEYFTDANGFLNINISKEVFNTDYTDKKYTILIVFNGNQLIENKTINLSLRIIKPENSILLSIFQPNIIMLFISLIFVTILIFQILKKVRQHKEIPLGKVIFKY